MSTKKSLARISCTIPEDVLAAADRVAAREQRSRSWVISEAVRRYAGGVDSSAAGASEVRESARVVYAAEAIAEGRTQRLRHNLELSPKERLARAEELIAFARAVHPHRSLTQVIGFETLSDFMAWKTSRRVRG